MSNEPPFFIVNADDLGLAESATDGIIEGYRKGVVTSASLVVTTPALGHAISGLARNPGLGVGLHFSLSAGQPVAPGHDVPSLVDDHGYFSLRFTSLLAALQGPKRNRLLEEIRLELDAQLDRIHGLGVTPDHINGERHIHLLPGVFELVHAAANRYKIPHVRTIDDVGLRYFRARDTMRVLANGGLAKYLLLVALSRRARRIRADSGEPVVRYASILFTGAMGRLMPRLWARPPVGATEVAVHPGTPGSQAARGIGNEPLTQYLMSTDRQRELDACIDARGFQTIARLGTFRDWYGARRGTPP